MQARVSGVWRSPNDLYVNVAGTWRKSTQAWVNVAGTWRRFFRKKDLLFNSNISLAEFYFFGTGPYYGAQNDANGNSLTGSMSNKYLTTGRLVANMQTGAPAATDGTPAYRWFDIYYSGDVRGMDMPSITWNGQKSIGIINNGVYAASPYNVTVYTYKFAANLPVAGTYNLYF